MGGHSFSAVAREIPQDLLKNDGMDYTYDWMVENGFDEDDVLSDADETRMMEELREIGIDYIVESDGAHKRISPEYIKCDYYDYLDGKLDTTKNLLAEYSWSEFLDINLDD